MRRSLRDAIVGFSLIGGIVVFCGSLLWLRGIKLSSNNWTVSANFLNASGLSEGSPVTYRGINIGSIGEIKVTPQSVTAKLDIDKSNLLLPKPVFAKVVKSSLLGGDVQVELISSYKVLDKNINLPTSGKCLTDIILCPNDSIKGEALTSISNLTAELERILKKATQEDVVASIVSSTKQFDKTQKQLEDLILKAKEELSKAEPIILELAKASIHVNNILSAIDNPETLKDIQQTASSTRSITRKIDKLGTDINKMMEDEELMNAFRNVTIGLGKFFNEIYP